MYNRRIPTTASAFSILESTVVFSVKNPWTSFRPMGKDLYDVGPAF